MKIAFLHMTMGLVNRGSEISTGIIASALSSSHSVLVLQSGVVKKSAYQAKRIYPLASAPPAAPRSLLDKILTRLTLDQNSREVYRFTIHCLNELKEFAPDIVVATNGATQLRVLKSSGLKSKFVVFGSAGIGHDDQSNLRSIPDLFIALTHRAESWAKSRAHAATRVVSIPNPLNLEQIANSRPALLNLPRPVVLTVSALSTYKNVIDVVRAIKPLNVSLLLIGDGEEADNIQNELSSFPGDFRWIKAVEPQELGAYYQAADAFCFLPDPQEAFGRVYLEAMAAKLPIVASDDPIRREIIGAKGLFADPHDLNAIRQKIVLAVNKNKVSYTHQLKEFSVSHVIKKIEKEFRALVK